MNMVKSLYSKFAGMHLTSIFCQRSSCSTRNVYSTLYIGSSSSIDEHVFSSGSNPKIELATIPGTLLLVRQGRIKSSKECLLVDAVASIRRTSFDYSYELVVTRTFAEGEEQLLEEDDESEEEYSFLLDEALRFGSMEASKEDSDANGAQAFTWDDVAGDVEDTYLFVTRGLPQVTLQKIEKFEDSILRCIYERKYQKSSEFVDSEALEHLKSSSSPRRVNSTKGKSSDFSSDSQVSDELGGNVASLSVNSPYDTKTSTSSHIAGGGTSAIAKEAAASSSSMPPDNRKLLVSETADLHLYDQATGSFMLQQREVLGNLWQITGKDGTCWITVTGDEGFVWVSTTISSDIPVTFIETENSMTFNYQNTRTGAVYTWLLRFTSKESFMRVNVAFSQGVFEGSAGAGEWSKLKPEEQKYHRDAFMYDVEMYDYADDGADEEQEAEEEVIPYEDVESEEEDEGESDVDSEEEAMSGKGKNSQLAVGYRDELSFVVRGDMIGVFRSQPKGQKKLKFMTNIQGLSTPDGKRAVNPSKVLLHDQDRVMVISDPHNPHSLYKLDLTTGRVVDEWKISDDIEVNNFLPESKFAQTTAANTLLGTSKNSLFRIDPRLAKSKLVDSQFKKYATKQNFSGAATTESGHLVVGTEKGDMKLFNMLGKNAKTAIPSLGDPIIGVDVTANGRYVLATCARYILFIDTEIMDGANVGRSGFERSFPAASKPVPKRLTLKPEHAAYLEGAINFTPAKFDTNLDDQEKSIVTSTGDYVIAWNLNDVKEGHVSRYRIRKYNQDIVADNFKFGGDNEIVITTPADVFLEGKRGLQRPTRQSLSGGIVNQY